MFSGYSIQLLVSVVILVSQRFVESSQMSKYKRLVSHNDVDCSVIIGTFRSYYGQQSLTECAVACHNEANCKGGVYHEPSRTCNLTSEPPPTAAVCPPLQGAVTIVTTVYGDTCTSNTDCTQAHAVCRQGNCGCGNGYSYQPSSGQCVDERECAEYGSSFQPLEGIAEPANNQYSTTSGTVEECVDLCLNPPIAMDPVGEIKRFAEFLGISGDEVLYEGIARTCSFGEMSKNKEFSDEIRQQVFVDNFSMFRKGKVGGWRDTFTVAQNEKFDRIWADRMKESTLKFRYTL